MKKLTLLVIVAGLPLFFMVGIGIGVKISQHVEEKEVEYCTTCPMCGWCVELKPINDSWYIECQNLACGLHTGYFKSKEHLVEKWNEMCEVSEE